MDNRDRQWLIEWYNGQWRYTIVNGDRQWLIEWYMGQWR